jgi:aldehyde dehydrogenase (NAD+)
MSIIGNASTPMRHPDRFYVGGEWVPATSDSTFDVLDSNTEELFFTVAEASSGDMQRAIAAAKYAFDEGPWPRMLHVERAAYMRALSSELQKRVHVLADIWPRESGVLYNVALPGSEADAKVLDFYADMADDYAWEEPATPIGGGFGLVVREPVGVVGAIVPWNGPFNLAMWKLAPALLAGCTIVLKASPEAPASAFIIAEAAQAIGLPAGVVNVLVADREVSEQLVVDARVDKISFTGSTAAGRRIASLLGNRIGRYTLELGGKSAAIIMDDADLDHAATVLADAECLISGQVCSSLTRLIISRSRHDEFAEMLAAKFSAKVVGSAFDSDTQLGPLAMERQRDKVEAYIAKGIDEGATLVTGGGRPKHLERGYFVEPTVFANVDNSSTIAQEEIFGPVLSVIAVDSDEDAVRVANDTIFGLNASVFTQDVDRARDVAARLRSGTVGHNSFRTDFGIAFGGFKQSGIGREGGREGLAHYLETKTVILESAPRGYAAPA